LSLFIWIFLLFETYQASAHANLGTLADAVGKAHVFSLPGQEKTRRMVAQF
jgi:hypothetical protein